MSLKIIASASLDLQRRNSLASIQQVRAYWEALRPAGGLPHRDQIDPRGLSDALEKVFLVERIAPGQARFRIAGTQLHDLLGMDLRGMPLSALLDPSVRKRMSEVLETAFTRPAVVDLWLQTERNMARAALSARMILLPLTGTKNEPNLALGCLAVDGVPGRAPHRFAIGGIVVEPIGMPTATNPNHFLPTIAGSVSASPPIAKRMTPILRLVSSRD